jgi:hypothetical protein
VVGFGSSGLSVVCRMGSMGQSTPGFDVARPIASSRSIPIPDNKSPILNSKSPILTPNSATFYSAFFCCRENAM